MLRCFDPSVDGRELDRESFKFHHQLMGYPALELENLAKVIPSPFLWRARRKVRHTLHLPPDH